MLVIPRASFPELSHDLLLAHKAGWFLQRHAAFGMAEAILTLVAYPFRQITKAINDIILLPCQARQGILTQDGAAIPLSLQRDLCRKLQQLLRGVLFVFEGLSLGPSLLIKSLQRRPRSTRPCQHDEVRVDSINVLVGLSLHLGVCQIPAWKGHWFKILPAQAVGKP